MDEELAEPMPSGNFAQEDRMLLYNPWNRLYLALTRQAKAREVTRLAFSGAKI